MRASIWIILLLFPGIGAAAPPKYSDCIDAPDPPACLARTAIAIDRPDPGDLAEAVVRHGLTDLIAPYERRVLSGTRDHVMTGTEALRSLGFQMEDDDYPKVVRRTDDADTLAAIALLTAARHDEDPFSNPVVRRLSAKARNAAQAPLAAVLIWLELIQGGNGYDMQVGFRGLPKLFAAMGANPALSPDAVLRIASDASFEEQTDELALPLLRRSAARPDLTNRQKAALASVLARSYDLADDAERLLRSGGEAAENYSVHGLWSEIATVRLHTRYDAKSARIVAEEVVARMEWGAHPRFEDELLDALERSGAYDELRELAHIYEERATKMSDDAGAWLANASDCYLRAGDREAAVAIARKGLVYRSARQERSVAPVVALYRAGAIDEALATGRLSGGDRYRYAGRAGVSPDPQWVLDEPSSLDVWSMVTRPIPDDAATMRRVFDALQKHCQPLTQRKCLEDHRMHLAHLAAALGDRKTMQTVFANEVREVENIRDGRAVRAFFAIRLAARWAHARELLGDSN